MAEDLLNENGLTVKTANNIRDELVEDFQNIYGSDINLDSNTQDGQIIDIYTQMNTDIRELAMSIYNSINPDMVEVNYKTPDTELTTYSVKVVHSPLYQ